MVCEKIPVLSLAGYLPAEHIETPTERLARLNKHKNIDVCMHFFWIVPNLTNRLKLSATMLGDTAEKSKNPLKKAMRRRNAKTVTFNPPTYYEANEPDWSDIEAEGESNIVNGVTNSNRNSGMQVDREAISTTDGTSGAKRDRAPNAEGADEKLGITGKGKKYLFQQTRTDSNVSRCCGDTSEECGATTYRLLLEGRQNRINQDLPDTRFVTRRS